VEVILLFSKVILSILANAGRTLLLFSLIPILEVRFEVFGK